MTWIKTTSGSNQHWRSLFAPPVARHVPPQLYISLEVAAPGFTSDGALTVGAPALAASGTNLQAITGSGGLTLQRPSLTGSQGGFTGTSALSITDATSYVFRDISTDGVAVLTSSRPVTLTIWARMEAYTDQGQLFCLLDVTLDNDLGIWSGFGNLTDSTTIWQYASIIDPDHSVFYTPNAGLGVWHHLAFVMADDAGGGIIRGYYDGVFQGDIGASATMVPRVVAVGIGNGFVTNIEATVGQARCWNVALTQAEIQAEMASPTAVKTANLYGDWPLASDLLDASGNGHPLTTTGTPIYVPLGGAITGAGGVSVGPPALAGTGTETFSAGAALQVGPPALAATGAEAFAASGALSVQKPGLASSGAVAFAATGALQISVPSLSAAALETFSGAAALTVAVPLLAAAALETFSATAALALVRPSLAASGLTLEGVGGTATLLVATPTLGAFGAVGNVFAGGAALQVGGPSLSAAALETFAGAAALQISAPPLAGTALELFSGTAALAIVRPSLLAFGVTGDVIDGAAALLIVGPSLTGAGAAQLTLSGAAALQIARPLLTGAAAVAFTGTGALLIVVPALSGSGLRILAVTGSGAIEIGEPVILGAEVPPGPGTVHGGTQLIGSVRAGLQLAGSVHGGPSQR